LTKFRGGGGVAIKVLMRIDTWDDAGRPRTFTRILDDEMVDLGKDPEKNHFVAVLADELGMAADPERIKQ